MSQNDLPELIQLESNETNVPEISFDLFNKETEKVSQISEYVALIANNEAGSTIENQLRKNCYECTVEILSEAETKSSHNECATQTDEWVNDIDLGKVAQAQEEEEEEQAVPSDNPVLEILQGLGQTVSEINSQTQKSIIVESKENMPQLGKKQLIIPTISTKLDTNALAIITAALVANDKELENISPQLILSLYCGMFNIFLAFLNVPVIINYLLKEGYKVYEVSIEEWTSRMSVLRKGANYIVAHFVGENGHLLSQLSWTLLGPFLCLLGHKPNKSNIHYWGNKMLRTFYTETNLPKERHNVLFHPSLRFCECLTYILEQMIEMKRHMFFIVYNTASTVPRLPGTVCRLAIEQLRGQGLLDFILIDQYLLVQNPFSLLLNSIVKHVTVLLEAYEKYMEFGHLAPWCTIIAPPEELQIFRHPAIKFVAAVARGMAIRKGVTALENYYPDIETEEMHETVEKAVLLLKEMRVRQPNE